jgi:hypothetical protein
VSTAVDVADDGRLSRATTKNGRLQRALLALYAQHAADGMLPTSGRFLWYELSQAGVVDKALSRGQLGIRRGIDQDVGDALTSLRELGLIPWPDIVDETRSMYMYIGSLTVLDGARAMLDQIRLDPWRGRAPLILCESRSLAGVLDPTVSEYGAAIASTNGQARGFLETELAPLARGRRVVYLGDWDWQGHQIEANTRKVLAPFGPASWQRVALTDEQVAEHSLPIIEKLDRRYRPPRSYPAVETEALGQRLIVDTLRAHLDSLLPESLDTVRLRERVEREPLARLLDRLATRPAGSPTPSEPPTSTSTAD